MAGMQGRWLRGRGAVRASRLGPEPPLNSAPCAAVAAGREREARAQQDKKKHHSVLLY